MSKKNKQYQLGIIALFPAIIISSILIILCVSASRSFLAFLYRVTIFDEKVQSAIDANSCSFRVLAKHIQNSHYTGGESLFINNDTCIVGTFSTTTSYVSVNVGDAVSTKDISF
jgi:hypothetical protein